jgi:hypothetical protein
LLEKKHVILVFIIFGDKSRTNPACMNGIPVLLIWLDQFPISMSLGEVQTPFMGSTRPGKHTKSY